MTIQRDTILDVQGMTCGSCVRHVTIALKDIDGVERVDVKLRDGTVAIKHDLVEAPVDTLIEALREAGYESQEEAVIRALTTIGAITVALAAASCARNESHGIHADHAGYEPAEKVELDTPAAPALVTVEAAREAAAPAVTATPTEPDEPVAEKPKAVLRP